MSGRRTTRALLLALFTVVFTGGILRAQPVLAGLAGSAHSPELQRVVDDLALRLRVMPRTNRVAFDQVAFTVVDLAKTNRPVWASHRGTEPIYPASVVKLFYLVAMHRWLEDGRLEDTPELQRAARDMIVESYNEATHYVVDVLTGTTSGPELPASELQAWWEKRNAVNRYFTSLGYAGINVNKKPWCEGPYGRETQAIRAFEPRRNLLTTDATARLVTEIATGRAVSPVRSGRMLELMSRDPWAPPRAEDQITGFSAGGLARGMKLWSKAGWTSETRHDAALIELPGGRRVVIVTFTEKHADEVDLIPAVVRGVLQALPPAP